MTSLAALVVVVLVAVTLIQGATVPPTTKAHNHHHHTGTGPTHEPNENDKFRFTYDHVEHRLIIKNGHNCYVANLSEGEMMNVHTDIGLKAIELKFLAQLSTSTMVDSSALSAHMIKLCAAHGGHINAYYTMS